MPPSEEAISTGPPPAAIDDRAQVKLAGDRAAFFDQHAVDSLAFRPGLDGDQLMAEDVGGDRFGLVAAADKLHAALGGDLLDGPLAASAGVDLGLDDRHGPLVGPASLTKASTAAWGVSATNPRGTATPASRRICLAWNS